MNQVEESPSCSEAKYQSSSELNNHAASELKYQSCSDIKYRSTCDVKYQSSSDVDYHNLSDNRYQCTNDTKYQSVYVMSDQKDECIIATEVRTHTKRNGQLRYLLNCITCFKHHNTLEIS